MRILSTLLIIAALAAPASAAQELDGSAWLLKGPGLFSASDKVTFWHGHFVRQSRCRADGHCTTYDSRLINGQVVWKAKEAMPQGVGEWRGVWNERTAVMDVTYFGPTPDGGIQVKSWRARRYADGRKAG